MKNIELYQKEFIEELNSEENSIYTSAFKVDLVENTYVPYKISPYVVEKYAERFKTSLDFRKMLLTYVLGNVEHFDCERVIQTLLPDRVLNFLLNHDTLVCEFQEKRGGKPINVRVCIKRLSQDGRYAYMGIVAGLEDENAQESYLIGSKGVIFITRDPSIHQDLIRFIENEFELLDVLSDLDIEKQIRNKISELAVVVFDSTIDSKTLDVLISKIRELKDGDALPILYTLDPQESEQIYHSDCDFVLYPYNFVTIENRINHMIQYRDSQAMLKRMERDSLTGFFRREFFYRKATDSIKKGNDAYLVRLRIMNFEMYIHKYGNVVTDLIIKHIALQLRKCFSNDLIIGKLGKSDFVFLCDTYDEDELIRFLHQIQIGAPIPNLKIKIGVAKTNRELSIETICDHAKNAIFKIGNTYGQYVAVYDERMQQQEMEEKQILSSMETALEQNQFVIYYQPKHSCQDGSVSGAEALVRWIVPQKGMMYPDKFIPVFEKVGFIRALDRYVFMEVCKDIVRWKEQSLPEIPVSINLSRRDFEAADLADWIITVTDRMGIERHLIHLEITESAFTDNPDMILSCIHTLHEAGFVIELDDFGVGYSSLNMLNSMDIDILKIDKSIIQQDDKDFKKSILPFCISLAKIMNLQTVAEGVEDEQQVQRVKEIGCDYIQGYYYSKPIGLEEFEEYIKEKK